RASGTGHRAQGGRCPLWGHALGGGWSPEAHQRPRRRGGAVIEDVHLGQLAALAEAREHVVAPVTQDVAVVPDGARHGAEDAARGPADLEERERSEEHTSA